MHMNLARTRRPQSFDDVAGQRLAVMLLKNSLAKGMFFPVYLLAGLRGSGKTTMGRIFAMAVNCHGLEQFQAGKGEGNFPCLRCASCQTMQQGGHPDFIEIDAASHTGVDNVRQIIEEAAFLPVMGRKKVYLIDEAHMLSKAAFNAFLKILEEPPATVLFLLATTDRHKILETVLSRSFQLFFDPITPDILVPYLQQICSSESISYDDAGLQIIARESGGSVRDALNMIERVRFAGEDVSAAAVERVLGYLSSADLSRLLIAVASGSAQEVLVCVQDVRLHAYMPAVVWRQLVALVRLLIWDSCGLTPQRDAPFGDAGDLASASGLRGLFASSQLIEFLDLLYRLEMQFAKSTVPQVLLERALLGMAQRCVNGEAAPVRTPPTRTPAPERADSGGRSTTKAGSAQAVRQAPGQSETRAGVDETPEKKPEERVRETGSLESRESLEHLEAGATPETKQNTSNTPGGDQWQLFVQRVGERVQDPIMHSVLRAGVCRQVQDGLIGVQFPKKFVFYQELVIAARPVWQPLLEEIFGKGVTLVPEFSGETDDRASEPRPEPRSGAAVASDPAARSAAGSGAHGGAWKSDRSENNVRKNNISSGTKSARERPVTQVGPNAQALQKAFPGTLTVTEEES
jgi:DNA polymerase-3 subunit gamma/tau